MGEHLEASCFPSLILHLFPSLFTLTVFQKHFRKLIFSCNSILLQSLQKKKKRKEKKSNVSKVSWRESMFIFSLPLLSFSFLLFLPFFFLRNYLVHIPENRVKGYLLFRPFVCPIPTPTWWPLFLVNYTFFRVSYAWTSK